jgi:hypothetical protein
MTRIEATSRTIACTLSFEDLQDVGAAWQKLLRNSLVSRDLNPRGLRLTVHPGAEAALKQLIDIEAVCCKWNTFALEGGSVTMTAEGAGQQVIRAMWVPLV